MDSEGVLRVFLCCWRVDFFNLIFGFDWAVSGLWMGFGGFVVEIFGNECFQRIFKGGAKSEF